MNTSIDEIRKDATVADTTAMRLEGIHHVTCITGDAPVNVDFYARVLGLRLVKKTVNQDDPTVYHLFYADEAGSPGADITFFEYPGARRGRAGAGMVHTVTFRVASEEALDFWEQRLVAAGAFPQRRRTAGSASTIRRVSAWSSSSPTSATARSSPRTRRSRPSSRCRASTASAPSRATPTRSRELLEDVLAFEPTGEASWEARGAERGGLYAYDPPPASGPGVPGAGTVHHVAWASTMEEHEAWQRRVTEAGMTPDAR